MATYTKLIKAAKTSADPLQVIHAHCIVCIGEDSPEICTSGDDCLLYPFRMGINTRQVAASRKTLILNDVERKRRADSMAKNRVARSKVPDVD